MRLHDLVGVKVLQVVERISIHKVDLSQLVLHDLRVEQIRENILGLIQNFHIELLCPKARHWIFVLDALQDHH